MGQFRAHGLSSGDFIRLRPSDVGLPDVPGQSFTCHMVVSVDEDTITFGAALPPRPAFVRKLSRWLYIARVEVGYWFLWRWLYGTVKREHRWPPAAD